MIVDCCTKLIIIDHIRLWWQSLSDTEMTHVSHLTMTVSDLDVMVNDWLQSGVAP